MPRIPFLNSTIPLPSVRPTSGSRLPNRRTATPTTTIISIGLRLPNIASRSPSRGKGSTTGRQARGDSAEVVGGRGRGGLLVGGHGGVEVLLDPGDPLLELGHALAQRPHDAREAVAENQERDEGDD